MPSWYSNNLKIKADRQVLDVIHTLHLDEDSALNFDTIIPYPDECMEADMALARVGGCDGAFSDKGFQWCLSNWGTQWNASSTLTRRVSPREMEICFMTPSAPPIPIIAKLAKMYPSAEFKMHFKDDSSVSRVGVVAYAAGGEVDRWEGKVDLDELRREILEVETVQ